MPFTLCVDSLAQLCLDAFIADKDIVAIFVAQATLYMLLTAPVTPSERLKAIALYLYAFQAQKKPAAEATGFNFDNP